MKILKKALALAASLCIGATCTMGVAANDDLPETNKKFNISFVGDSICETGKWSELFPDAEITNFGVGGENTDDILARFEQACGDYDKMFIVCGVNDWNVTGWSDGTYTGSMSNFENMFKTAKKKMPNIQIYVTGILPTCKNYSRYITNNITPTYNSKLKALTEKYDYVTFIGECWNVLLDSETGVGKLSLYQDGLHPNRYGFAELQKVMLPYVYETRPDGNIYYQYKDNNSAIRFVAEVNIDDVVAAKSGKYQITLNSDNVGSWDISRAYRSIHANGNVITASEGKCFIISDILTGYMPDDDVGVVFTLDNYDKGILRTITIA